MKLAASADESCSSPSDGSDLQLILIVDLGGESTDQRPLEVEKMDQIVIEDKCQSSKLLKEPEQDNKVFLNAVLDGRVDISVDLHEAKRSSSFHY